jgi:hypothetical protein
LLRTTKFLGLARVRYVAKDSELELTLRVQHWVKVYRKTIKTIYVLVQLLYGVSSHRVKFSSRRAKTHLMSKNWRFVRRCAIHFIVSSVKLGIKPEKINNDDTNIGHRGVLILCSWVPVLTVPVK